MFDIRKSLTSQNTTTAIPHQKTPGIGGKTFSFKIEKKVEPVNLKIPDNIRLIINRDYKTRNIPRTIEYIELLLAKFEQDKVDSMLNEINSVEKAIINIESNVLFIRFSDNFTIKIRTVGEDKTVTVHLNSSDATFRL